MAKENDAGEALRDSRNKGLQEEQERLQDPEHHTPDEPGGNPVPADALGTADRPDDSAERLKNPPQVDGPREESNDMV